MYDWCVRQQRQHPRPLSPATPATVAGVSAEDAVRSVGIAPSPAAQRAPAGVGGTLRVVVQRNGLLQVQVGAALLELAPGDIVRQDVAAIVNAANESLANGGGVCGAIHRAAGVPQLEAACRALGTCPTGEARITSGFKLAAQHIIHAVGPRYRDHTPAHAAQLLENAYRASLELASIHRLPSIAFPSLSTGIFGFPIEQAAPVAVRTIVGYLAEHPEIALVRLVLRDDTRVAFETELLALVSA
ncbi:MAG: macro domain-containing protein [Chloroflexales bacterium]|nr:macro domain-containing protein [Chloroflexales bacterium]